MWIFPIIILVTVQVAQSPSESKAAHTSQCRCEACECRVVDHHARFESANFSVRSFSGGPQAQVVAAECEEACARIRSDHLGLQGVTAWRPKCEVVLHASREEYYRAVGQGVAQTVGSSVISFDSGRISRRRIDLLACDSKEALSALPHELVHVLLVDVFPSTPPPKWAEEGLALLADPTEKQVRHARDLEFALSTNTTLPLAKIVNSTNYPSRQERATFYAQSMSLAEYLSQLKSPRHFLRYIQASIDSGHHRALKQVYNIDGIADLQRRWQRHAVTQSLAHAGDR